MYMTNEEWEQNNQDYLKESYEETGFTAGGYVVHKLICGGYGRVFYTTIYTKKYCHSYWCRQSGQQSAAAGIPPNAPSGFGLPVLR